jgi:hypothetical protein
MGMKRNIANIFTPIGGTWKSYTLKHWHGKRIKWRGKYVKIVAAKLDRNMNFVCWQILVNGNERNLNDPNYIP